MRSSKRRAKLGRKLFNMASMAIGEMTEVRVDRSASRSIRPPPSPACSSRRSHLCLATRRQQNRFGPRTRGPIHAPRRPQPSPQADANTKVASRTLRAGHDDTVSGLRRGRPRDGDFGQQHAHFRVLPPQARGRRKFLHLPRAISSLRQRNSSSTGDQLSLGIEYVKSRPFCATSHTYLRGVQMEY